MPEEKSTQPQPDSSASNQANNQQTAPVSDNTSPGQQQSSAGVNLADPGKGQYTAPQESDVSSRLEQAPAASSVGMDYTQEEQTKKSYKAVIIGLVVVLLLGLLGGAAWYFIYESPSEEPPVEQPVTPEPETLDVSVDALETEDSTPQITGSVDDPEALVVATVDGEDYEAVVNPDGSWVVNVSNELAPGSYNVSVFAEGSDLEGEASATLVITTSEPEALEISAEGIETEDSTPQITGSVDDPEALVVATVDGEDYEAVVNPDGSWVVNVSNELSPGTYDVLVVAQSGDREGETVATIVITETEEEEELPEAGPEELPATGPR